MCGSYGLADISSVRVRFGTTGDMEYPTPRYNAAPTQSLPVVSGGDRRLSLMRWGLVPPWARTQHRKPDDQRPQRDRRREALDSMAARVRRF